MSGREKSFDSDRSVVVRIVNGCSKAEVFQGSAGDDWETSMATLHNVVVRKVSVIPKYRAFYSEGWCREWSPRSSTLGSIG